MIDYFDNKWCSFLDICKEIQQMFGENVLVNLYSEILLDSLFDNDIVIKDFKVIKLWDFVIKSLKIHIVWFQQIISKIANLSRHLICGLLKLQINIFDFCQQKPIKVVSSSSPKLFERCLKERSLKPMVLMPESKEHWRLTEINKGQKFVKNGSLHSNRN
jgi:hypothetical protein